MSIAAYLLGLVIALASPLAFGQEAAAPAGAFNPIRLAYTSGPVSLMRFGANDWVNAQINTPLAVGDALFTGPRGMLELQAEGRIFIRADADSTISIVSQTPDFLQLKVSSGRVSLDARAFPANGYVVEMNTPSAAFTIDQTGYYRVDVSSNETRLTTRKGGRAIMSPALGDALTVHPSEEIVIHHNATPSAPETYVAPALDAWDRWNYDRTRYLTDATSERYLPPGVAGARDLDLYGSWRLTDDYGAVWVPDTMPSGWAPYSTGRWIWDPYYQWTWVDDAAWGWAPYHYGRWVYLGSYWAWAPGPVVRARPVYAPALVGFYGVPLGVSLGLGFGGPGFGWVALGWGEPLIPWWGLGGFIGLTWWGGWHGPRVVNNVIVQPRTVINVTNISYRNAHINRAIVTMPQHRFGNDSIHASRDRVHLQEKDLQRFTGELPVKPNPASLNADAPRASLRPNDPSINRPVVAVRRPAEHQVPWQPAASAQETRQQFIAAPAPDVSRLQRPAFGSNAGPELARPPQPPRPPAPRVESPRSNGSMPMESRSMPRKSDAPSAQAIPGIPANRVYREHMRTTPQTSRPSGGPSGMSPESPAGRPSMGSSGGPTGGPTGAPSISRPQSAPRGADIRNPARH